MTVDDLLYYYVDDYIEIYSIEEEEIVFKGIFENDYIVINI